MLLKTRDRRTLLPVLVTTCLCMIFVKEMYNSGRNDGLDSITNIHKDVKYQSVGELSKNDTFEEVIEKYLSARKRTMYQEFIARDVFNIKFPNGLDTAEGAGALQSFPFLTSGTLKVELKLSERQTKARNCLLYTSPSPRDS